MELNTCTAWTRFSFLFPEFHEPEMAVLKDVAAPPEPLPHSKTVEIEIETPELAKKRERR